MRSMSMRSVALAWPSGRSERERLCANDSAFDFPRIRNLRPAGLSPYFQKPSGGKIGNRFSTSTVLSVQRLRIAGDEIDMGPVAAACGPISQRFVLGLSRHSDAGSPQQCPHFNARFCPAHPNSLMRFALGEIYSS